VRYRQVDRHLATRKRIPSQKVCGYFFRLYSILEILAQIISAGLIRVISGTLMTSLDMSGFSISLVLLPPANEDVTIEIAGEPSLSISANMLLDLFDAPSDCPGWKSGHAGQPSFSKVEKKDTKALVQEPAGGEQKPTEETVTGEPSF
jgi:dihydroxyacetone kinase